MSDLGNHNCLITGASRGFGAQLARSFWEAGASLMLIARSQDDLGKVGRSLPKRAGQNIILFTADLCQPSAPEKIMAEARKHFKKLDVLVNNAGIHEPIGAAWLNDWQEWQKSLQVNLLAPIALCRLCVPWMKEHNHGKIINLSGGGGTGPRPNVSAYATAKAGLIRFSETLAEEVREFCIDINCISPGPMFTKMLETVVAAGIESAGEEEYNRVLKVRDQGGADPLQAAALCVYLASSASNGITGKIISAVWDPWKSFSDHFDDLRNSDVYTLRRIVPKDRGMGWGDK